MSEVLNVEMHESARVLGFGAGGACTVTKLIPIIPDFAMDAGLAETKVHFPAEPAMSLSQGKGCLLLAVFPSSPG